MNDRDQLTLAHESACLAGNAEDAAYLDAALSRLDAAERDQPIRMPIDTWLSGGPLRAVCGFYLSGRASVTLIEDGRTAAVGQGATLTEAFAAACNDLQGRMG